MCFAEIKERPTIAELQKLRSLIMYLKMLVLFIKDKNTYFPPRHSYTFNKVDPIVTYIY